MVNLRRKYRFWRSIRIGKPLYLDEHGRRIDGPPLKFWQIWIIRVKLWFGLRWTDDA